MGNKDLEPAFFGGKLLQLSSQLQFQPGSPLCPVDDIHGTAKLKFGSIITLSQAGCGMWTSMRKGRGRAVERLRWNIWSWTGELAKASQHKSILPFWKHPNHCSWLSPQHCTAWSKLCACSSRRQDHDIFPAYTARIHPQPASQKQGEKVRV